MRENPAGLVYGTILIATLLSAEYSRRETYPTTIGAVLVALALYWLALAYSEFTGRRIQEGEHFTFTAFRHAAKHENSVLLGAMVPIGVLVICWIFGVELGTAVEIGVYSAAGLVVVYELLIGYWSDASGRELIGHTVVGVGLGLLIITLRVVLH
jgi:membrane protein YqaA with SNARE-associated domain